MISSYFSLIVVPAAAAVLSPFAAKIKPRLADFISIAVLFAGLVIAASYIHPNAGALALANAFNCKVTSEIFQADTFSVLMLVTIYLVGLAVAVFSSAFVKDMNRRGVFFGLLSLCVAGMSGVVIARDFFTMYVFLEVVAVCSFVLIAFDDERGTEGAIKYFFMSAPASMFIVLGVALLMLYTGGTSFSNLAAAIAAGQTSAAALTIILAVIVCGFLVKAGLVPFHAWTPDAYESAPAPVSALLAGIITKVAGVYALVRIMLVMRALYPDPSLNFIGKGLMFFGMLSIIVGALGAMAQTDFKRMLAYSSISQVGYIILGAGMGTPLALAGAIFHLFNHATFKTTLFLNSAALEQATGTTNMKKMGGLESRMPWTSWTSIIALLATAGIPPLSGFWSKLMIIAGLWKDGAHAYAIMALLASVLTLAYFLMMQHKVFFGKTQEAHAQVREAGFPLLAPVIIFAALMIIIGLYFPILYTTLIEPSAKAFL